MYLTQKDWESGCRPKILNDLTDGEYNLFLADGTPSEKLLNAEAIAIAEATSYLTQYDTDAIFATSNETKNAMIVRIVRNIAIYELYNVSEHEKPADRVEDYNNARKDLERISSGELQPKLPKLDVDADGISDVRRQATASSQEGRLTAW